MPRSRGRPSKLTTDRTRVLAECLEKGLTYAVACSAAGINYTTFRGWILKGQEAQQGEYFDFHATVRTAEMVGRRILEERALKEARPLDILERRYPEDWGKTDRHEVTGTGGGALVINLNPVNTRTATELDADD